MAKRGRPRGAKNISEIADVQPSRCKCGSSRRSKYSNPVRKNLPGAREATAVMFRRCKCLDCGQWRVDREFEYGQSLRSE